MNFFSPMTHVLGAITLDIFLSPKYKIFKKYLFERKIHKTHVFCAFPNTVCGFGSIPTM